MIDDLCTGITTLHDDRARSGFLDDVWRRRDELRDHVTRDANLSSLFDAHRLPSFLLGGSSSGKIVVMGVNPGADHQTNEEAFKRASCVNYIAFHERFMEEFPKLRRNGRQPYWTKLLRVVSALEGEPMRDVDWGWLARHVVGQDLIPLASRSDEIAMAVVHRDTIVRRIAEATVQGLIASRASRILAFTPKAFAVLGTYVRDRRDFVLTGTTKKGDPRDIRAYTASLGNIPVLAVSNALLTQPRFTYGQLLPQLRCLLGREPNLPIPASPRAVRMTVVRAPVTAPRSSAAREKRETVTREDMVAAVDALVSPNEPIARLADVYAWFESVSLDWGEHENGRFGRFFELAEGAARRDRLLDKWKVRGGRQTGWSRPKERDPAGFARATAWAADHGWRRVRFSFACPCGHAEKTSYAPRRTKACPLCGLTMKRMDVDHVE